LGTLIAYRRRPAASKLTTMRSPLRPSFAWLAIACVALAALSLAAPLEPRYDAWGWILWGRDLLGPLGFDTTPYPSWKPGAALITTALAPTGDLTPDLWLLLARTGALLSLAMAWRLGSRLAGPVAGAVAVLGVLLSARWFVYFARGSTEGLLVLAVLAAIDRHLDGRHNQALALGAFAALLRPEAWPFLLLYAAWRLRHGLRQLIPVGTALLLVAVLWFGGDSLGSGDPFWAGKHAQRSAQRAEAVAQEHPWLGVVETAGEKLLPPPLAGAALIAVAIASRRPRDRVLLGLAAVAACWIAIVGTAAELGYPGLTRFMLPAGALVGVLAGVAISRLVSAFPGGLLVSLAIALAVVGFAVPRLAELPEQYRIERSVARTQRELETVIARLGGAAKVRRCRVTTNQPLRTRLAWELDVPAITQVHLVAPTLVIRNPTAYYGMFRSLLRAAGEPGGPRLERLLATDRLEVWAVFKRKRGCALVEAARG
jgi:hypothetical protein